MQSFKAAADDLETSKLSLDEQGNEEALKFKTLSVEVQKLKEQKWDQQFSFANGNERNDSFSGKKLSRRWRCFSWSSTTTSEQGLESLMTFESRLNLRTRRWASSPKTSWNLKQLRKKHGDQQIEQQLTFFVCPIKLCKNASRRSRREKSRDWNETQRNQRATSCQNYSKTFQEISEAQTKEWEEQAKEKVKFRVARRPELPPREAPRDTYNEVIAGFLPCFCDSPFRERHCYINSHCIAKRVLFFPFSSP